MQTVALKMDDLTDTAAPFMAFAADRTIRGVLVETAAQFGFDEMSVVSVNQGFDEIIKTLHSISTPKILIVDLSEAEDIMSGVDSLANVCDPGCKVIIIGRVNDVNIYRTMIDEGVQEYLVKPVSSDRLSDAIKRIQREPSPQITDKSDEEARELRRIAFVGVHGGAGASTVAANTAWLLSTNHTKMVSLIDLDLTFGTQALLFDTEPGKGLADALMTPTRVDELFLKRALTPHTETLHLLASEADPGNKIDVNASAIGVLFEHMRDSYETIALDLPRDILIRQPIFLNILDEVVLVSEPSLVGLRDATRIARMIKEQKSDIPVRVALNRIGLMSDADLSSEIFAKNSGLEVIGEIPFDAKAAGHAATKGRVMVDMDKRSKITAAFHFLTENLLPEEEIKATPKPLWARLTKRG